MGLLEILPRILGRVTIPASVASESQHSGAPKALRTWIARPPSWLTVEPDPEDLLEETHVLGAGEAAAITLAWNHRGSSYLILDEKRGRSVAKMLGLPVTGLLAILVKAAITGEVEFDDALSRLLATGFRLSPALMEAARTEVKNAKGRQDPTT
jgi:predicted nucleic acid-binding protein